MESEPHDFFEVLLSRFVLTRCGRQAHLEVSFDGAAPACRNRRRREAVRAGIPDFQTKAVQYQRQLEALLFGSGAAAMQFDDDAFPFRWVSAGVLPVLLVDGEEYYCLFYRDIFPIGWNIANGACDSMEELLNPLLALERELTEELVILEPRTAEWSRLSPRAQAPTRVLEESGLHRLPWRSREAEIEWIQGPDSAVIRHGDFEHRVDGCYLNVNALDNGMEVDRVAKIPVSPAALVFDGESSGNRLVNRLAGLFRAGPLHRRLPERHFLPDKYFFRGQAYPGSAFREFAGTLASEVRANRTPAEAEVYAHAREPFDLCPVARNLIRRHAGASQDPGCPRDRVSWFSE